MIYSHRLRKSSTIFLVGLLILMISHAALALEVHPLVEVTIDVRMGESNEDKPLTGEVVLTNTSPASLPAVFEVSLYHNEQRIYNGFTEIKTIFSGKTRIPFDAFHIPSFETFADLSGTWRLEIKQQNVDEAYKATKSFVFEEPEDYHF